MRLHILKALGWIASKTGKRGRKILALGIGLALYYLLPERRRLTVENLRYAFPATTKAQILRLARRCFINLALVFLELLATPYLSIAILRSYFHFVNPEVIRQTKTQGQGVVLLSAHLANWEWSAIVAALEFGEPLLVVVKQQRDYVINQWLDRVRQRTGNILVPMHRAAKSMLQWLEKGGIVALLVDQAAEPTSDVFVPFFGRPAITYKAPVLLARRMNALLVVGYSLRDKDGRYVVQFVPIPRANDPSVPVEDVVAEYTHVLESVIRQVPEQWVWQHNRWKYLQH
ncbi:MAG: lysophospholipid acyltransferase family protein [Bacteroidota bacterium]|nr:lysophospholipid acyltransferase family protein [Candidatus Kapabacteria bacterium]MDW8074352.1 lysophospholipid acyltransferase family protein [Bacteroidota bacterium]